MQRIITNAQTGAVTVEDFTQEEIEERLAKAYSATEAEFAAAIQVHIDTTARSKSYADGFALASYVNSTVPAWAAEAAVFVAWRDQVWVYAYTELAKVQAGQRPKPTIENLIAELPQIAWP